MGDYINNFLDPLTGYTGLPRIGSSNAAATQPISSNLASLTDLMSFSMPSDYFLGGLATGTQGIRINACGTFANNTNFKSIYLYFGSQLLASVLGPFQGGAWRFDAIVLRITDLSQTANVLTYAGLSSPAAPPASPLTATLVALPGNVDVGTHQYVVTYVVNGIETGISAASGVVVTAPGSQQVSLTTIPIGPAAGTTARSIYRTKAGAPGVYYFLFTISDNVTTTTTDNIPDLSLGGFPPSPGNLTIAMYNLSPTQNTGVGSPALVVKCQGQGTLSGDVTQTFLEIDNI